MIAVTIQQLLYKLNHSAKFSQGLHDVEAKFQPNPVKIKQLVQPRTHIQKTTKRFTFSSESQTSKKIMFSII